MTKYRKLRKGEILREGDEYLDSFGRWQKTLHAGKKTNDYHIAGCTYRRKIGWKK